MKVTKIHVEALDILASTLKTSKNRIQELGCNCRDENFEKENKEIYLPFLNECLEIVEHYIRITKQ